QPQAHDGAVRQVRGVAARRALVRSAKDESGSSEGDDQDGDDGGCSENGVVFGVAGVVEEEVVPGTEAGKDSVANLNVAALVCGGDDVEGSEAEAYRGSGEGVEGDACPGFRA